MSAPFVAPARPVPPNKTLVVAAVLLWALTAMSLVVIGFFVLMIGVWGMASGEDMTHPLLQVAGTVAGAAVVGALLYFAPGVRRLSREARFTLLGALACPAPLLLAAHLMTL
ncbi:hypothetical protein [Streptomyces nojiriensis]|uniref:Uncharacterized protein n=1 Tax=Streptomyces nojiriensis TaxID=66374 RepID=A0ABQ3SJH1_9ACTN|nr:hypothetical protein [Streptomyces nojiriensis]QTI49901.1 hypothetical protein JYK04_07775 [Streptomyces nojiriensis]GGS21134.1 hypothetical protein GCM10010205_58890 [Streptomyces nojiriensis]GHI68293.1 hypothetical protein Snoj_22110 [Streptomyces nojiriensis]